MPTTYLYSVVIITQTQLQSNKFLAVFIDVVNTQQSTVARILPSTVEPPIIGSKNTKVHETRN